MRAIPLALAALIMSGCSEGTPPSAYKHLKDQLWAATGLHGPCFRTTKGEPGRLPDAECYRLTDPQRMRGVAITGFETGSFYPGMTTLPPAADRSDLWVEVDPRVLPREVRSRCQEGCAVYLDFIGRRTAVQGNYGHMGLANHIVIVDRVVRANLVE